MSMITGCPHCGTMFKVVPDQLKISEGWVRCGHCGEVFDAASSLQGNDAVRPAGPRSSVAPADVPDLAHAWLPSSEDADPPLVSEPLEDEVQRVEDAPPSIQPGAAAAEPSAAPVQLVSPGYRRPQPVEEPGYPRIDFIRGDDEEEDEEPPRKRVAPSAADEDAELEDLNFLRDAKRKALWSSPPVRRFLVAAAVVLAGALGLQFAVHDRDRLAATQPHLRPWLEGVCRPLGCSIGAPRRIESIVIESSGFTQLRGDAFRLSFTLKNQARQPVAVPSLELTLTDTQDQPVVRRVLTPRELGAPADTIAAASEWSAQLALAYEANGSAARISGYRLLAFYP